MYNEQELKVIRAQARAQRLADPRKNWGTEKHENKKRYSKKDRKQNKLKARDW